jgi:hypothetical protein
MGKQRDQHPLEDNPFAEDFVDWINSPEGELSGEVHDTLAPLLEKAGVDAKNRKIIWEDGQRLSITESAQRIHANYPDFPLELIETHVIGWLEMEYAPPTYSEKQLDELDRLTGKWVDDHERQAEARSKRGKTRHS